MKFIYLIFFFLILLSIITIIIYRKRNTKNSKDCVVSEWVYGKCDRTTGYVLKNREVISQPENGGKSCPLLEDKEACFDRDCKVGEWEDISGGCDRTTGILKKIRPIITDYVGKGTKCPPLEKEVDCPRDCKLTEWSDWTRCDRTIGRTSRTREIYLAQRDGGNACPTNLREEKDCEKDCETSPWGVWSCDRNTGIKKRTRSVISPAIRGGDCITEEVGECERDCKLGGWKQWSCDRATGIQKRTKAITISALRGGNCLVEEEKKNCDPFYSLTSLEKTKNNPASNCTYGIIKNINNDTDGIFVRSGCQESEFLANGNTPIYCSNNEGTLNYCVPKGEVFHVKKKSGEINKEDAENVCKEYNSRVAKMNDLRTAILYGGDWCNGGWLSDSDKIFYPNQIVRDNCGNDGNILSWSSKPNAKIVEKDDNRNVGVNCYGKRPEYANEGHEVLPFSQHLNPVKTSMYN